MESELLRPATSADIPRLMEIRASVRENRLTDPGSISAADYQAFVDQGCCWVCGDQRKVTGFAALDAEAASVWALFIVPEAEGRGLGRALLDRLVREARERGIERLTLSTGAGSRAEQFYRRAGWSAFDRDAKGDVQMQLAL